MMDIWPENSRLWLSLQDKQSGFVNSIKKKKKQKDKKKRRENLEVQRDTEINIMMWIYLDTNMIF